VNKDISNPPTTINDVNLDVLEDTLSFYIRSINIAVSRHLDERLDGLDVARGTGKITTLLLVDTHPGIRPSVIAQLIIKDRSAMGRLVDQMDGKGLLTRKTSSDDTRAQELYITAKGKSLAARVRKLISDQNHEFFSAISDEDQKTLIAILRKAYRQIVGLT
jgi:DNA-binding MarR family transcriptional regulator